MRLILLLSFVFLFCLPGLPQIGWGIKGGFNWANQKIFINVPTGSGGNLNVKQSGVEIPTFQVGVFAEIPLSKNVSFMPELSLFGKGANFSGQDSTGNFSTAKLRMHYLEVPLCIVFKHPLKKASYLWVVDPLLVMVYLEKQRIMGILRISFRREDSSILMPDSILQEASDWKKG